MCKLSAIPRIKMIWDFQRGALAGSFLRRVRRQLESPRDGLRLPQGCEGKGN